MKTYKEFMTPGTDIYTFVIGGAWIAEADRDGDMATITIRLEYEDGRWKDMVTVYYRYEDGVLEFDSLQRKNASSADAKKIQKVVNDHMHGATFNNVKDLDKHLKMLVADLKKTMK